MKRKIPRGASDVPEPPPYQATADAVADALDADVLFFNGPVQRHYDNLILGFCEKRRRRANVFLILITTGGNADAAYRIARFLQRNYQRFTCFIPGYCKSAGTLVALGANELVISDDGEMGPLDVQMTKKDELAEMQSGLTSTAALTTLHDQAFEAFQHFLLETKLRSGGAITTRTATDIAVKLTCGLFSQLYQQLDPMHIGEAGRAMQIARQYGVWLREDSQNFTEGALDSLTSAYPSHGFVIDREEASKLFTNVRPPTEDEAKLVAFFGSHGRWPVSSEQRSIAFISTELPPTTTAEDIPAGATGLQNGAENETQRSDTKRAAGEEGPRGEPEGSAPDSGAGSAQVTQLRARR